MFEEYSTSPQVSSSGGGGFLDGVSVLFDSTTSLVGSINTLFGKTPAPSPVYQSAPEPSSPSGSGGGISTTTILIIAGIALALIMRK